MNFCLLKKIMKPSFSFKPSRSNYFYFYFNLVIFKIIVIMIKKKLYAVLVYSMDAAQKNM